jgi:hypothetical protein
MDLTKYQNINNSIEVSGNNIVPYLLSLSEYLQNIGLNVMPYPKIVISKDTQYMNDPFGRTAYYDPNSMTVVLYVAGRHIKDVLRSFAHEMIHHKQNLEGALEQSEIDTLSDPQYAQHNPHLRKMEAEAYLKGNLLFRDWEDSIK